MRCLRASGVRRFLWILLPVALTTAAVASAPAPKSVNCHGPRVSLPQVCGATLRSPEISCLLFPDVEGGLRQANSNVRQRASDLFSWQAFVGFNWPIIAGYRGVPDPLLPITAPGPRVWESWKETSEVFRERNGEPVAPASWNTPEPLPAGCGGSATKLLFRDEKVDDALDAVVQPTYADGALPGTLTDQARHRVRYEIRMNQVAFNYIVQNRLWDGREQSKVTVSFPPESQIVKAAWREVTAGEAGRFQTSMACVCDQGEGAGGLLTSCQPQLVGLVGLHVMTKTESAKQWIWSTFEQVVDLPRFSGQFKGWVSTLLFGGSWGAEPPSPSGSDPRFFYATSQSYLGSGCAAGQPLCVMSRHLCLSFELHRAQVAQGRMTPMKVVPALEELEDGHAGLDLCTEATAHQELAFQGSEEAFTQSVVEAVAH